MDKNTNLRMQKILAKTNNSAAYYRMTISFLNMLYDYSYLLEDDSEREIVIDMMESNNLWEVNDYENFIKSMKLSKHLEFLSEYTIEDFKKDNVTTYKLTGYNIGFALKPYINADGEKCVDIISVHNNSSVHNIGKYIVLAAVKNGGNTLDHFDGFLSNLYSSIGFKMYAKSMWKDEYAPKNWDYNVYGKPDVIYRKYER